MYLKRLEIFGFKSFAEKTQLDFGPGITAVVGPNGSGKSNVSDAVRWVLGEQSARALRGGAMADVIFAGSDSKRAMGFAEVSLVLDNADGKLGVGFTEVMVTRRVDRSGEGEYFINQVPCRLKDVQDLFLDTGVGKDNYSIIGQGKIDEIITSKPEDRRVLFEEAAGISRYKSRKREAQRRLEETEQNLLRITDIIGELESQLGSLAEQAERAEKYSELQAELTRLDIGLIAHALGLAATELDKRQADNRGLRERLNELEGRLQAVEQAADVARNLADSLDHNLSIVSADLNEASGRVERAEGRLLLARQEQKANEAESQRLDGELTGLESKLEAVAAEVAAVDQQVTALQAALAEAATNLSRQEQNQTEAQTELAVANRAVEERKNRIVAILQMEAERKNQVLTAEREQEDAARRLSRLEGEREKAGAEATAARDAASALAAHQAKLAEEREQVSGSLALLRQQGQKADQELQRLQQEGASLREQIQGSSSRLGAIEELINSFEGYQKGTRTVLQGRENGLPFAADVLGAVAEVVRTEPKYEKAIEIALGGSIQNIITASDTGAKNAIEHLKRVNGGRATFLPLNTIRPNGFRPDEEREFAGAPGIIGTALDLVRFEERFRPAMASLLGRVLIATDLDAALSFGKKTGQRFRIVTLDGELLAAGGALTGGSTGGHSNGLLSRERERDDLTAKIGELRQALTAARKAFEEAQTARAGLGEQIKVREQELRAVETQITQAEGESVRLAGEVQRWAQVLETYAAEAQMIQADAKDGSESADRLKLELAGLVTERELLEAEVARMNAEGQAKLAALEEQAQALTAVQVKLAELNQELRGLTGQSSRLVSQREALRLEQEAKTAQKIEAVRRMQEAAEAVTAAQTEVAAAALARQSLEEERVRLQTRKLEALEQVNSRERELRGLRRTQTETQGRLQAGEVEEARLQMERDGLVTRLAEQHGLDPAAITGKALPADQIGPAKERTQVLREAIRELGPVNLQAIEEYRSAQERCTFLGQQRDDLEEAKGSLYRAVDELDKRIKTHFMDSFQVIRREFQKVYQELFEGGRADLQLVDENDLLETGVEIIAQPPGKKPQTLTLLSGGEKAMTAIALLFALLRVRPTPFVIMDEVEAALDEANVERFGKYLRVFTEQGSQFICISHQRGTMEAADALYGVTMEGTGVSRVVSVRLVDVDENAS